MRHKYSTSRSIRSTTRPSANDDSGDGFATDEDNALEFTNEDLLANDTDGDGHDTISVDMFDATSQRGATITRDNGTFTYDPTGSAELQALTDGETVDDTFTYTIMDDSGLFSTATVTISVAGLNDAPIVTGLSLMTDQDSTVEITEAEALATASDATPAARSASSNSPPTPARWAH